MDDDGRISKASFYKAKKKREYRRRKQSRKTEIENQNYEGSDKLEKRTQVHIFYRKRTNGFQHREVEFNCTI